MVLLAEDMACGRVYKQLHTYPPPPLAYVCVCARAHKDKKVRYNAPLIPIVKSWNKH